MKKKIKRILTNYLQISSLQDINSRLNELKLDVDIAIKKLDEMGNLTTREKEMLEFLKQGYSLKDIETKLNLTQTRISMIFRKLVEKIYRITGDF